MMVLAVQVQRGLTGLGWQGAGESTGIIECRCVWSLVLVSCCGLLDVGRVAIEPRGARVNRDSHE